MESPIGCHLTSLCVLQTTVIEEDKEFVHSYFDMPDEDFPVHRQSPWLLRITLNRDLMVDKKLSLEAIAERINTEFEDELHCIFNDDNAEVPALRVCPAPALTSPSFRTAGVCAVKAEVESILLTCAVKYLLRWIPVHWHTLEQGLDSARLQ